MGPFERMSISRELYNLARSEMNDLARVSGGRNFEAATLADARAAFARVAADIGTLYSLGYYPTNKARDGKFRAIKLEVRGVKDKAQIRARDGYYAPESNEHSMPNRSLFNRILLIVLDGAGIGAMPDAPEWGDAGSDTFGHILESRKVRLPNLQRYGLGNIRPLQALPPLDQPSGSYGRCALRSNGKDTTTGHWEMAGIILDQAFPTYPNGFPVVCDRSGLSARRLCPAFSATFPLRHGDHQGAWRGTRQYAASRLFTRRRIQFFRSPRTKK